MLGGRRGQPVATGEEGGHGGAPLRAGAGRHAVGRTPDSNPCRSGETTPGTVIQYTLSIV